MKHLFLAFTVGVFIMSCTKEVENSHLSSEKSTEIRSAVLPTLQDGRLNFKTRSQIYDFLVYLDSFERIDANIYRNFAQERSYNSLYISEGQFENETEDVVVSTSQPPFKFADPLIKTLLNNNYEYGFLDSICFVKNHKETWLIHKDDISGIAVLRSKLPGTYIQDSEITGRMRIHGSEGSRGPSCCDMHGLHPLVTPFIISGERFQAYPPTGLGIKHLTNLEVFNGLWGIYAKGKALSMNLTSATFGKRLKSQYSIPQIVGLFRDKDCTLKHTDNDNETCGGLGDCKGGGCWNVWERIFYRNDEASFFKEFELRVESKDLCRNLAQTVYGKCR